MPVNLVNEQTFRQFLTLLSYKDEDIPVLTPDNLRDKQFVSVRQDDVIRAMIGQWIKDNVRKYLLADETARFLSKITSVTEESPKWLKKALATGENVYEFNPDKIPDSFYSDIREIKDYLYDKGVQYIKKMLSHTNPTFNLHALKSLPAISGFQKALEESHQWHSKMVENTKFQTIKQSGIGCLIMNLDNGFSVVQLLTPEELDFESQAMGHCVGKGSYDSGVKSGFIKIYSIRDKNIKPHVTLEIRENAVCQCKGKGNKEPAKKYLPLIQKFIKEFDFEIDQDMKNIGLIKQEGEYLSLFDLPEGFVFNRPYLDLSEIDLERANLNIVVEELNLSKSFNFPQKMDFSDIDIVNLEAVDFQKVTEIKWPKKS